MTTEWNSLTRVARLLSPDIIITQVPPQLFSTANKGAWYPVSYGYVCPAQAATGSKSGRSFDPPLFLLSVRAHLSLITSD